MKYLNKDKTDLSKDKTNLSKNIFFRTSIVSVISTIFLILSGSFFVIFTSINRNDPKTILNEDKNEIELLKETKKIGYDILLSTMSDYIDEYNDNNFDNFLKIMWPNDYEILKKSREGIEGYSRNYNEWKNLFDMMIADK